MSKNKRRKNINNNLFNNADKEPSITMEQAADSIYGFGNEMFSDVDTELVKVNEYDGSIQFGSFRITPKGLELDGEVNLDTWLEFGERLHRLTNSLQWVIGDWANIGYDESVKWVEVDKNDTQYDSTQDGKYKKLIAITGRPYGTLRNYASVAARFPLSRRRDSVAYSFYVELNKKKISVEEQESYLDAIEANEIISVRHLREVLSDGPILQAPKYVDQFQKFRSQLRNAPEMSKKERTELAEKLRELAEELENDQR